MDALQQQQQQQQPRSPRRPRSPRTQARESSGGLAHIDLDDPALQALVAQRVAENQAKLQQGASRDDSKKFEVVREIHPDLTDDEIAVALSECGNEDEAVMFLLDEENRQHIKNLVGIRSGGLDSSSSDSGSEYDPEEISPAASAAAGELADTTPLHEEAVDGSGGTLSGLEAVRQQNMQRNAAVLHALDVKNATERLATQAGSLTTASTGSHTRRRARSSSSSSSASSKASKESLRARLEQELKDRVAKQRAQADPSAADGIEQQQQQSQQQSQQQLQPVNEAPVEHGVKIVIPDKIEGAHMGMTLRLDDALAQGSTEGWSLARIEAFQRREENPNSYYYRFNDPGVAQKNGKWSKEEETLFFARMKEVGCDPPKWGIFSQTIPGRVGYQCSNFYRQLLKEKRLTSDKYIVTDGKLVHVNHAARRLSSESGAQKRPAPKKAAQKPKPAAKPKRKPKPKKAPAKKRRRVDDGDSAWSGHSSTTKPEVEECPLPEFIDPITCVPIVRPQLSPVCGHMFSYDTWRLAEYNCPMCREECGRRGLITLTKKNIESHRAEIKNLNS